nr:MAG TPA: hypothetical protein [Caudoviricetes sp.]
MDLSLFDNQWFCFFKTKHLFLKSIFLKTRKKNRKIELKTILLSYKELLLNFISNSKVAPYSLQNTNRLD